MRKENRFGVSSRQWKKWTHLQRYTFELVYTSVRNCYMMYPAECDVTKEQHKVVAWNAAFMAACEAGK